MKKNNQSKFELLIQDIFYTCPLDEEDEKRILNIDKTHKEEIAEKDKEIEELKQQQLFKEDFKKIITTNYSSKGHKNIETWELKNNLLYNKLPSKEELKNEFDRV